MIKKIWLIIFGVSLIFILELSLYFTGRVFLFVRNFDSPRQNNKSAKQICCIGDSHTFGVGTSYRYSYPKQLEVLLNLNNPATKFNVVNLGIPGNSTKTQIERLAKFLSKNKVDLVIFLTGRNNYYEVELWRDESFLKNIIIRIQKLKTYRILQYILNLLFKLEIREDMNSPLETAKYLDYIEYQLNNAKYLCEKFGCKLVLVSYYNSDDAYIEKFAKQSGILYLNLYQDFFKTIPLGNIEDFVSKDGSHLNYYGNKIFSELLYKQMYLYREALNLTINTLGKEIDKDSFHQNPVTYFLRYIQGKSIFYKN